MLRNQILTYSIYRKEMAFFIVQCNLENQNIQIENSKNLKNIIVKLVQAYTKSTTKLEGKLQII